MAKNKNGFKEFHNIIKSDEVVNIGKGIVEGLSSKGNGLNILKKKRW